MKYNLSRAYEAGQAMTALVNLTKEGKLVELKAVSPRRSLNQNAYLHLLLGYFGSHFGYTREEAKMIYKTLPGNDKLYVYEREVRGKVHQFIKSSRDLTKDEMTKSIDIFRAWSARGGLELPAATDQEWLREIENEIERNERHL